MSSVSDSTRGSTDRDHAPPAGMARDVWLLGRRRSFLVPGTYQIRWVLMVGALAAVLLAALNAALYKLLAVGSDQIVALAPELAEIIRAQDRDLMSLILVGSAIALAGVMAVALLETHRTAGPLYNLARTLDRLREDGPWVRLTLRKDDHFREIETAFNRMATEIEARAMERGREALRIAEGVRNTAETLTRPGGYDAGAQTRLRLLSVELQKLGEILQRG
jgi:hypothetical protein